MLNSDTFVRRLRVRAHTADAPALRRRVVALAAGADLDGALPNRAAVLCVRRLRDPRPGTFALGDRHLRPAAEWEAAARARVSELAGHAARPARGAVPSSADAVLFLDRSELLACLACDWIDQRAADRWWWRALFGAVDTSDVGRVWREEPAPVPAACELLAGWRRLDAFVDRLATADVVALTRAVARVYGLAVVERALVEHETDRAAGNAIIADPLVARSPHEVVPRADAVDRAAWVQYAPELTRSSLAPASRLFAILALVLHRAPSRARRLLSDAAVRSILAAPAGALIDAPRGRIHPSTQVTSRAAASPVAGASHDVDDRVVIHEPLPDSAVGDAVETPQSIAAAAPAPAMPQPLAAIETTTATRPSADIVDTKYGGVFFLINVGIAFGLYADFTSPQSPGIDLPVWDFIALVATRMLDDERFDRDPVVPLLARLARRDSTEPLGAGFVPDDAPHIEAWLDMLVPRIISRLAVALAIDEAAVPALLLRRDARVTLSLSHLDVAFSLDDLPIAIRLAGLDRDPGFVPAAGLDVRFSYV